MSCSAKVCHWSFGRTILVALFCAVNNPWVTAGLLTQNHVSKFRGQILGSLRLKGGGRKYRERVAQHFVWKQTMWKAASCGDSITIKKILKEGAEVNVADKDGWTACHWAASKGHANIIWVLSKNGADINLKDRHLSTPLHWAAAYGHRAAIETLCAVRADLHARDAVGSRHPLISPCTYSFRQVFPTTIKHLQ
jgi:hypothetical protein